MKKNYIYIFLIIIILIILILTQLMKKRNNNENNVENNLKEMTNDNVETLYVNSYYDYYAIQNAVQRYIVYCYNEDKEAVFNLLDENYKDENKITIENIFEKIKRIDKTEIVIKEMKYEEYNTFNKKIYVNGYIYEYNGKEYDPTYEENIEREYEEINLCVVVDEYNSTFSIIPQK